jgi:hypothetical protein
VQHYKSSPNLAAIDDADDSAFRQPQSSDGRDYSFARSKSSSSLADFNAALRSELDKLDVEISKQQKAKPTKQPSVKKK